MNSLHRLIRVLEVFEDEPGIFSAEQLYSKLGYTRSTTYRYLKVLSDNGLLTSWHGNGYSLGPRVVELQASMMARDPLLLASKPEMQQISKSVRGVVALNRRFKDKLLCVHAEVNGFDPEPAVQVGRGWAMLDCAASRVVLARLAAQQLRKFYSTHAAALARVGFANSLADLRSKLKAVRDQAYDFDRDDDENGVTNISVVLVDAGCTPLGCLTLTVANRDVSVDSLPLLARRVVDASQTIYRAINV